MSEDEELAGNYFDKHEAGGLTRDGIPAESVEYLRQWYVKHVLANPQALKELREDI